MSSLGITLLEHRMNNGVFFYSKTMPEIDFVVLSRWFEWIISNTRCNLDLISQLRNIS